MTLLTDLSTLLELENTEQVTTFRFECDDLLMWPYIRFTLFDALIRDQLATQSVSTSEIKTKKSPGQILRFVTDSITQSPYTLNQKSPALFFCAPKKLMQKPEGYYDRIIDPLAHKIPGSFCMERPTELHYFKPRAFQNISYWGLPFLVQKTRVSLKQLSKKDLTHIENLLHFIKNHPVSSGLKTATLTLIKNKLIHISAGLSFEKKLFETLLKRTKPELIFFEDGMYGMQSHLIKWAKDHRIVTCEPQHGLISPTHPAYTVSAYLGQSAQYKQQCPDYFLSYGEAWTNGLNLPIPAYPIGNPFRAIQLQDLKTEQQPKTSQTILLCSGGMQPDLIRDFGLKLVDYAAQRNATIIVRPHPVEYSEAEKRYGELLSKPGVSLCREANLYKRLASTDMLIGDASTVLYEAIGIVPNIHVLNNPLSQSYLWPHREAFSWITTPDDLDSDTPKTQHTLNPEEFWATDWETRFEDFLKKTLKQGY